MARASSATSATVTPGASRVPPAETSAPGRSNTTNPGTVISSTIAGPDRSRPVTRSAVTRAPPIVRRLVRLRVMSGQDVLPEVAARPAQHGVRVIAVVGGVVVLDQQVITL